MHALARGAVVVGLVSLLSAAFARSYAVGARPRSGPVLAPGPGGSALGAASAHDLAARPVSAESARCPERTLPESTTGSGGVLCLPLPKARDALRSARLDRLASGSGQATVVRWGPHAEGIPRLPERPEDYGSYQLPLEPQGDVAAASGEDLSRDDLSGMLGAPQRPAPEPTGIRIEAEADAPVVSLALEGQTGQAETLLVGQLYGVTVVARHRLETGSGVHDYLLFYGHLARPGADVVSGSTLQPGAIVGYAGNAGGADSPHLYFEVRELRQGVQLERRQLSELVRPAVSIPCDPRNVLPLR